MKESISAFMEKKLQERAEGHNLRALRIDPAFCIDFYSNDYLGFSRSKGLHERALEILQAYPSLQLNGSTGSRLLAGNSLLAEATEQRLAQFFDAPAALVLSSGYSANLALVSTLPQKGDCILYDELIHASLKDAYRLSFADHFSFKHNDLKDLAQKLEKQSPKYRFVYVLTESVFSMDGDSPDMEALCSLCKQFEALLLVDEAHSTGVFGEKGQGLLHSLGLQDHCFARIMTFGKGFGIHGAAILGSRTLRDYLVNFARPFIYTTASPPFSFASIMAAVEASEQASEQRQRLWNLVAEWKTLFGAATQVNESPIQTIPIQGVAQCRAVAKALEETQILAKAIAYPTVPAGKERLRICLHAYNQAQELFQLKTVLQKTGVIPE